MEACASPVLSFLSLDTLSAVSLVIGPPHQRDVEGLPASHTYRNQLVQIFPSQGQTIDFRVCFFSVMLEDFCSARNQLVQILPSQGQTISFRLSFFSEMLIDFCSARADTCPCHIVVIKEVGTVCFSLSTAVCATSRASTFFQPACFLYRFLHAEFNHRPSTFAS